MTAPDAPPVEPLTLTLGQRVRYAASLRRATERESYQAPSGRMVTRRKKVWKRGGAYFGELDPGEGVVVGLRTLSDGYADWEDEEVGYTFESTHRHRAVLIATHIRHKHVLALFEDVEPLPVTEQRDDTAELARENTELRRILSECAAAAGGAASPDCSLEFFAAVPREIALVRSKDTAELIAALRILDDALDEALYSLETETPQQQRNAHKSIIRKRDQARAALARVKGGERS